MTKEEAQKVIEIIELTAHITLRRAHGEHATKDVIERLDELKRELEEEAGEDHKG